MGAAGAMQPLDDGCLAGLDGRQRRMPPLAGQRDPFAASHRCGNEARYAEPRSGSDDPDRRIGGRHPRADLTTIAGPELWDRQRLGDEIVDDLESVEAELAG